MDYTDLRKAISAMPANVKCNFSVNSDKWTWTVTVPRRLYDEPMKQILAWMEERQE